jgi:hypothetical protein
MADYCMHSVLLQPPTLHNLSSFVTVQSRPKLQAWPPRAMDVCLWQLLHLSKVLIMPLLLRLFSMPLTLPLPLLLRCCCVDGVASRR